MRFLLALVALTSATSFAGIVWRGDYETQNLSQYDSYVVHQERWTFVNASPAPREGNWAARIELHGDDVGPSNLIRTEIGHTPPANTFENSERFYAWSAMGSTTDPLGAFDHQIMFWECVAPIYQQEMSLHINANTISFATSPQGGQYMTRWTGTFAFGVWHDFILHVKWSLDSTVGFVELYYDGAIVLPKTFVKTMHADGANPLVSTMHHGLFLGNARANKPIEVIYLDAAREGTTLADVQSVVVDAGQPDAGVADAGPIDPEPDAGMRDAGAMGGGAGGGGGSAAAGGGSAATGGGTTTVVDGGHDLDGGINGG